MGFQFAGADLLANQRSAPRAVFQRKGKLIVVANGLTIPIKTIDVSSSGIGFMSPEPLPPKQICALHISTLHHGAPSDIACKGTIAYCILSGTQGFRVGIQYTEIEPASKNLIDQIVSAAR